MRKAERAGQQQVAMMVAATLLLVSAGVGCDSSPDPPTSEPKGVTVAIPANDERSGQEQIKLLRRIGNANEATEPAFYDLIDAGRSGNPDRLAVAIRQASSGLETARGLIERIARRDLKEALLKGWRPSKNLVSAYSDLLEAIQRGDQSAYSQARLDVAAAAQESVALVESDPFEGVEMSQEAINAFAGK